MDYSTIKKVSLDLNRSSDIDLAFLRTSTGYPPNEKYSSLSNYLGVSYQTGKQLGLGEVADLKRCCIILQNEINKRSNTVDIAQ